MSYLRTDQQIHDMNAENPAPIRLNASCSMRVRAIPVKASSPKITPNPISSRCDAMFRIIRNVFMI